MRTSVDLKTSLYDLEDSLSHSDYSGFDPYDIKGTFLYMRAFSIPREPFLNNIIRKIVLAILLYGESFFPVLMRKLFLIKPKRNAKGIALVAKGYFNLYLATGDKEWRLKGIALLNWLVENKSSGYNYPCWGYPFDWNNGKVIPAGTPASVVTAAVFDAFWQAWIVTKEEKYKVICEGIAYFFIQNLNICNIDSETICFSYTPLDNNLVHNTNLMVADSLLRIGLETDNDSFTSFGLKAANYAIKEQNDDGSLFYYGKEQNHINPDRIDHYHTGFEIRCLRNIWMSTGNEKFKNAYLKYYNFYRENLIVDNDSGFFPLMYPMKLYPINIHSCAEAILLNGELSEENPSAKVIFNGLIDPILNTMRMGRGSYKYMIRKIGPFKIHANIEYVRWGQSWMFLALSKALLVINQSKD